MVSKNVRHGLRVRQVRDFKAVSSALDLAPLAAIAGLSGFGVVSIVLLLLDLFHWWLVWPLGVLAFAFCGFWVYRYGRVDRPGTVGARFTWDLMVIAGVIIWGGYNIQYTSQHVLTNRDPATYANAAVWLSERNDLRIVSPSTLDGVEGISWHSAGFDGLSDEDHNIYAQGNHLLPALLGAIGKIVGSEHALRFNILFGMTALLAMYCFGRLFMAPYWAAVATAALAASMPLLYFSRDTYTEPLALTFTFGGLALLWVAQKNRHLSLWVLAGVTSAAGVLNRIDAYLSLVGIAAFLVIYLALAGSKEFSLRLKEVLVFLSSAIVVCGIGHLDLMLLSKQYYRSTESLRMLEFAALGAVFAAGAVVIFITRKYPKLLTVLNKETKSWRQGATLILILVIGLFLMSRPLWMKDMNFVEPYYRSIAGIQQTEGFPAEPRTYAEMTTYWVGWYIGPVLAFLGLMGLAAAAYSAMKDKSLQLVCGLAVVLGTALVYFLRPSITPDQIWASRRFLPVIMPGIALFGGYMLSLLSAHIKVPSLRVKYAVMLLVGIGLVIPPLVTARPMLRHRDTVQLAFVSDVCRALPSDAIVVWVGVGGLQAVQPTLTFCNIEAYGYHREGDGKPSPEKLAEIAKTIRSHNGTPVIGVYNSQADTYIDGGERNNLTTVHDSTFIELMPALITPPNRHRTVNFGASLAIIDNDGGLSPLQE